MDAPAGALGRNAARPCAARRARRRRRFLFFYALATLPLAEAITLSFLSPLFLAVLASLILKEPIQKPVLIAIAVGFVGMGVIVAGKIWAAASSTSSACSASPRRPPRRWPMPPMVLLRKRAQTDPFGLIILFQNLFPLIIITPFAWAVWEVPETRSWTMFLGIGALASPATCAWPGHSSMPMPRPLGVLEYTALVWSAGLGYLVFAEVPAWTTWAGAGLIVAGLLTFMAMRRSGLSARRRLEDHAGLGGMGDEAPLCHRQAYDLRGGDAGTEWITLPSQRAPAPCTRRSRTDVVHLPSDRRIGLAHLDDEI